MKIFPVAIMMSSMRAQMPVMMEPSPSVNTVMSNWGDASTGVSKVEVVDAKDAEEEGEENADKELFGRVLLHHHHLALAHWGGHGLSGHHGLACLHAGGLRDRDRHRLTGDHHLLSGLKQGCA
ncbi:MAG: hypothetical protein CM15mP79_1540 [Methanobacteriota archaeon]|nr:MAG: hypothetical protein CM15mP79_1540 [Euryarchaeota archaeon]